MQPDIADIRSGAVDAGKTAHRPVVLYVRRGDRRRAERLNFRVLRISTISNFGPPNEILGTHKLILVIEIRSLGASRLCLG